MLTEEVTIHSPFSSSIFLLMCASTTDLIQR